MSSIMQFITSIEKILIIICILCYIPTSIFVFAPTDYTFTAGHIVIYQRAYDQVFTPFILYYDNQTKCQTQDGTLLQINQYCFVRANQANFMVINQVSSTPCQGNSYRFDGLIFCPGQSRNISNYFQSNNLGPINFIHSDNNYPIFRVNPPLNNLSIEYYHYVPDYSAKLCKQLAQQLSRSIQERYSYYYLKSSKDSSVFLWYYTLPIIIALVILLIVNQVTNKFNLRRFFLMTFYCVGVSLLALIIKGIINYSSVQKFKNNIFSFGNCFVKEEKQTLYAMSKIQYGIGNPFIFFIGVTALLIFLSIVGQVVMKLLQLKYDSVREQTEDNFIELGELKTSLRSRKIKDNSSLSPSKRKITLQSIQS